MKTFWEVILGLKSLFIGMGITLREFFKPTITTHYPRQTLPIPARYRGHIQLTPNPDNGASLCIACKSCERACPRQKSCLPDRIRSPSHRNRLCAYHPPKHR